MFNGYRCATELHDPCFLSCWYQNCLRVCRVESTPRTLEMFARQPRLPSYSLMFKQVHRITSDWPWKLTFKSTLCAIGPFRSMSCDLKLPNVANAPNGLRKLSSIVPVVHKTITTTKLRGPNFCLLPSTTSRLTLLNCVSRVNVVARAAVDRPSVKRVLSETITESTPSFVKRYLFIISSDHIFRFSKFWIFEF